MSEDLTAGIGDALSTDYFFLRDQLTDTLAGRRRPRHHRRRRLHLSVPRDRSRKGELRRRCRVVDRRPDRVTVAC